MVSVNNCILKMGKLKQNGAKSSILFNRRIIFPSFGLDLRRVCLSTFHVLQIPRPATGYDIKVPVSFGDIMLWAGSNEAKFSNSSGNFQDQKKKSFLFEIYIYGCKIHPFSSAYIKILKGLKIKEKVSAAILFPLKHFLVKTTFQLNFEIDSLDVFHRKYWYLNWKINHLEVCNHTPTYIIYCTICKRQLPFFTSKVFWKERGSYFFWKGKSE